MGLTARLPPLDINSTTHRIFKKGEQRIPHLTYDFSKYLRAPAISANMAALASKTQSQKIFEKLRTKPANRVSIPHVTHRLVALGSLMGL